MTALINTRVLLVANSIQNLLINKTTYMNSYIPRIFKLFECLNVPLKCAYWSFFNFFTVPYLSPVRILVPRAFSLPAPLAGGLGREKALGTRMTSLAPFWLKDVKGDFHTE